MDSNFNNENDPWEFSRDIDDFDLRLTPVLHSSSSTSIEPSPLTSNPVRIIPGPAGPFFILDKLSKVAESPRLVDKMKYIFRHSHSEDESFARLMRDLFLSLRISLSKKRRLVAELEAVREVEGAVKCLEHMRVIVARDAVTLGELETLLGRAQVRVSLKAGFVADMEVKD
nr:hypothetical protein [Tanacetum cinerariifolium]